MSAILNYIFREASALYWWVSFMPRSPTDALKTLYCPKPGTPIVCTLNLATAFDPERTCGDPNRRITQPRSTTSVASSWTLASFCLTAAAAATTTTAAATASISVRFCGLSLLLLAGFIGEIWVRTFAGRQRCLLWTVARRLLRS